MKLTKQQAYKELNLCLLEQGLDWYNDSDRFALFVLGLYDLHGDDIVALASEIACR